MEELITRVKELAVLAFPGKKKKTEKRLGFYLQHHFGKSVWMPKDLNEEQLKYLVSKMETYIIKKKLEAQEETLKPRTH